MSWRERSFAVPIQYAPDTPANVSARKSLLADRPIEPAPSAVLVFHGMGQQVRFETLSDLASAILDEAEERGGNVTDLHIGIAPEADVPGQFLARAEIAWTDKDGVDHAAHVYEAYWAPLTEGKVTYWETIRFLLEGGCNGLRSITTRPYWRFDRWVFGKFEPMEITRGTPAALAAVLGVVVLTIGMIALAGQAVAAVVEKLSSPDPLTAFKVAVQTIYNQFAGPLNAISRCVHMLLGGGLSGAHQLPMPGENYHPSWWLYLIALTVWCVLVGLVFFIRYFIVAYVGAVAAYLSPYKDSKFEELRSQIQKVGMDAARLIYYGNRPTPGAEEAPRVAEAKWIPDYQNIVFVSHSLGTVLAYDTLNAIFNLENTNNPPDAPNRAVERTRALITFGSPLDKAAFIFRAQFNRDTQIGRIREEMACAIQPLITDYKFRFNPSPKARGPRWINLWSPLDIISGSLSYYDDPTQAPSRASLVDNISDPACTRPLYAHVQYWGGELLRKTVYDQLI